MGQRYWLALVIGNSRWHWGAFKDDGQEPALKNERWLGAWHTPRLSEAQAKQLVQGRFAIALWPQLGLDLTQLPAWFDWNFPSVEPPDLWVASVVKAPLAWLATYPALHRVETAQVPLQNTYPTLGVDRALALLGAGETWGWPVLVIDCGTALTFTAGDDRRLMGGAILPGLRLQFRALHAHTDQLPAVQLAPDQWPQRWAMDTPGAIASGILYTQLAGIRDFITAWDINWPGGSVVLTGGDGATVFGYLQQQSPALAERVRVDPDLGFWGLRICRQQTLTPL
jgi:type III pantothenate kinase